MHLFEVKGFLTVVGLGLYLVAVLLPSSLGLGPLRIMGGTDLGEGFLRDPFLLLPHHKGFFSPRKLLLSCEEQLLHLLNSYQPRVNVDKTAMHQ
jgi:hypothetical protein